MNGLIETSCWFEESVCGKYILFFFPLSYVKLLKLLPFLDPEALCRQDIQELAACNQRDDVFRYRSAFQINLTNEKQQQQHLERFKAFSGSDG